MCLLNPSLRLNNRRPIYRAPAPVVRAAVPKPVVRAAAPKPVVKAAAPKPVDNGKSTLNKDTKNKMNIAGLRNAKPCGRCGGAR